MTLIERYFCAAEPFITQRDTGRDTLSRFSDVSDSAILDARQRRLPAAPFFAAEKPRLIDEPGERRHIPDALLSRR